VVVNSIKSDAIVKCESDKSEEQKHGSVNHHLALIGESVLHRYHVHKQGSYGHGSR